MSLMPTLDPFERYFRAISYLVALCGLFALFVTDAAGILVFTVFVLLTIFAWFLEGSRFQLSERLAVIIVAIAVIGFIADWKFRITGMWSNGIFAAAGLARLILFLAAVKLFQKKVDKDWILIYLISFFQVLLAAGLSISPLYLVSLFLYLFFTTCAIIAFEIRKSMRAGVETTERSKRTGIRRVGERADGEKARAPILRLSFAAIVLLCVITLVGIPVFFSLPRGNAAGFGGDQANPVNVTGFSDSVTLGTIGRLQQSDAIVMRVRIDQNNNQNLNRLMWRGVALDNFDNRRWRKTNPLYRRPFIRNENNLILLDYPNRRGGATIQTFYLEPMSTNVLFALHRPFAIAGVELISKDAEDALLGIRDGVERMSYTVYSDTFEPEVAELRADDTEYSAAEDRYLQIPPNLDPRIKELADKYVSDSKADNRFDIAKTLENRLRNDYSYSLDMKAGGKQPVADFLFNVRAGHCEYFSSALAMMLRTQGIATRVVNGFQSGEFNETAGVYIVRQQHAHSWVEAYFPDSNSWITLDATPASGFGSGYGTFFGAITGYIEALETFWIQYVVAFDGQEQRSLFRSFRDSAGEALSTSSDSLESLQALLLSYWRDLTGDNGVVAGFRAAAVGAGVLLLLTMLVFFGIVIKRLASRLNFASWLRRKFGLAATPDTIEFYERMRRLLAKHGLSRKPWQTPAEFAADTGFPEVISITDMYHRVRFGQIALEEKEKEAIRERMESIGVRLASRP